ncbi:MAG: hypothetical protein LUQ22_06000 [Methanotrichaceae archaeon]|nr:hypothetical protein [Methanotrichaceae archaeon]
MNVDEIDLRILREIYVKSSRDSIPPKPLIKAVGIDEQQLADKLEILEKGGYVKTKGDSANDHSLCNGIYLVMLTAEGRELLRKRKEI